MPSMVRATFVQSFTYRPFVSVDHRGVKTYGEPVPALCRYQPSTRLIRDARGQEVVEEAVLFTEAAVTDKDLVWPTGTAAPEDPEDTTGSREPLAVHTRYRLFSQVVDHYEVHL
ncbi:hypothetical protein [Hyalangium sp.]|uniref:hypothetical protein n=1 Tax=Hyalangium sp. TaxID=2028555 RepID=UPI002D3CB88B|nr:hypothetical protein [Hyalangium sp.]HYI01365.1 hypothetical protein [Hyalangium sp.]